MKKLFLAAVLSAACVFIAPASVKAATALDAAYSFNNLQYNYLNQQNDYYNQYQIPVMDQYAQAMSNQTSQALAAAYQAQILRQQALQRNAVNGFQMAANLWADNQNFTTQMMTMGSNVAYNSGMSAIATNQMMLTGAANTWGLWMGQVPFPQVP